MHCPKCDSSPRKKNGFRRGKQSYKCNNCSCQYVAHPQPQGYPLEVKQVCIKMYLNGMGIRGISRVTEISHTAILNWIQEAGESLSDEPQDSEIPEITEIDELQTYIGRKKDQLWIWTVVNYKKPGIILWATGDRSHSTFERLWQIIKCWRSFWYVTRTRMRSVPSAVWSGANAPRWKVYPMFIEPEDHLVCKTYMTRVERENTRLRHYLARLHRKTLCYSKSSVFLQHSLRLLLHYLKFNTVPIFS